MMEYKTLEGDHSQQTFDSTGSLCVLSVWIVSLRSFVGPGTLTHYILLGRILIRKLSDQGTYSGSSCPPKTLTSVPMQHCGMACGSGNTAPTTQGRPYPSYGPFFYLGTFLQGSHPLIRITSHSTFSDQGPHHSGEPHTAALTSCPLQYCQTLLLTEKPYPNCTE